MDKNKDTGGFYSKGGYIGLSRNSRRNRSNNLIDKWLKTQQNNNNKPKGPKKPHYKSLIMLIIGIILILAVIIKVNLF